MRLIYERGAFTAASVGLTADCLRVLAFGLPFWGLLSLSVRGLLARRKQAAILCIGIAQNAVIALGILLAGRFSARIETLLIPYVGFNIIGSIALTCALFAGGGRAYFRRLALGFGRITIAVIVVALVFGLCQRFLPRPAESGTPARLAYLGLAGSACCWRMRWPCGSRERKTFSITCFGKSGRQRLIAAEARIGTTCGMIIELRRLRRSPRFGLAVEER